MKNKQLVIYLILICSFITINLFLGSEKINGVISYKYSSISFPCTLCGHTNGSKVNTAEVCAKPCNPIYGFYSEYVFWGFIILGLSLITLYWVRFKKLTKLSFIYNLLILLIFIIIFEVSIKIFSINVLSVSYWEGVNAHYYLTHSIFTTEIIGETLKTYLISQSIIFFVFSLFIYLIYGVSQLVNKYKANNITFFQDLYDNINF